MNENELKQQYANYISHAYNITVDEYANKGFSFDKENSTDSKLRYSKTDIKNATDSKVKVTRVLIEKNPEFTFEYFKSYMSGKYYEPLPAFKVFMVTNNYSIDELSESEKKSIGLQTEEVNQEKDI